MAEKLVDKFRVAFFDANVIACDLAGTISHAKIEWR
jgi:hypothetical protein